MNVSTKDKLDCARRELSQRQRVYPRWVEAGRMTRQLMERELARMAAIVRDYEELLAREQAPQGSLL